MKFFVLTIEYCSQKAKLCTIWVKLKVASLQMVQITRVWFQDLSPVFPITHIITRVWFQDLGPVFPITHINDF